MFDKKLLIVKFWFVNIDIKKIDVENILIWVCFFDLDIKFWGMLK